MKTLPALVALALATVVVLSPSPVAAQQVTVSIAPGSEPQTVSLLVHNSLTVTLDDWLLEVCRSDPSTQVLGVTYGAAAQALNGGNGPELYLPLIDNGSSCPLSIFVLISLACFDSLPIGDCLELHEVTYSGPDSFYFAEASFANCFTGDVYYAQTVPSPCGGGEPTFMRGDADGDGNFVGLIDGLFVLNAIFAGGPQPACRDAADFDDSGSLGLPDGFGMLTYQYAGGPPPAAPSLVCGIDPTDDDGLECESYTNCP